MLRCLATSVVCALVTATPFSTTTHSVVAASQSQDGIDISSQAAPPRVATVGRAGDEDANSADEAQGVMLPRNAPVQALASISQLAAANGATIEEAIGGASDAALGAELGKMESPELTRDAMCHLLHEVARDNALPEPLFTRLIWQESRFRADAVSPVGAQGIAQFMPATAKERGLDDPLDPIQALPASAEFLSDLVSKFGNFGLAAAAYNGGPGRVSRWLKGKGGLPKETRDYVVKITGKTAEHWKQFAAAEPHPEAMAIEGCEVRPLRVATAEARAAEHRRREAARVRDLTEEFVEVPLPQKRPPAGTTWLATLTGSWSEKKAHAVYADLKKKYPKALGKRSPTVRVTKSGGKKPTHKAIVRLAAETRAEAQKLCKRLKEAGGACVVKQDPA